MMDKLDNIEQDKLIDRFLDNELEGEILEYFEQLMQKDSDLAQEVEFRKELIFTLQHQKLIQFNRKVENVLSTNTVIPDLGFKWYDLWSAKSLKWSFVLILPILFLFSWQIRQNSIQKQHIDDFLTIHIQHQNAAIGLSDTDTSFFAIGLREYDALNYSEAIISLTQHFVKEETTYGRLYLGLSYLFVDRQEMAILEFKKIINSNGIFAEDAKWYLALTYLKQKNLKEAKTILEELAVGDDYNEKAIAIMSSL